MVVENQQPRQATAAAAQKADGPAEAVAGRPSQGQQAQSKAKGKYNQMIGRECPGVFIGDKCSDYLSFMKRRGYRI